MRESTFLAEIVRKNWYLFLALAGCVVVAVMYRGWRSDTPPPADAAAQHRTNAAPDLPAATPTAKRLTPAEEAERSIEQHRAEYDAAPNDERAPSLLLSIGNLYLQKLRNYDHAISTYEELISKHPEWEGIRKAYVQLGDAYEKSGQAQKAASVYEEMTRQFPPDSVEFDYATQRLAAGVGHE